MPLALPGAAASAPPDGDAGVGMPVIPPGFDTVYV